jgi:hypothetical protein
MAAFTITFIGVAAGADPGDPGLERTENFEFDDPSYGMPPGSAYAYGPPNEIMQAAVDAVLEEGEQATIVRVEFVPVE